MPGTAHSTRPSLVFEAQADRTMLELAGPQPEMRFRETDQTDPAGRFRLAVNGDIWLFQRANAADWAGFDTVLQVGGSTQAIALGGVPVLNQRLTVNPITNPSDVGGVVASLQVARATVTVGTLMDLYRSVQMRADIIAAASAVTVNEAATLQIEGAPSEGANITITDAYALWIDAGASRFDGDVLLGTDAVLRANTASLIGISVSNAALTPGSLGSLIIPVRTTADNVDGTDAEIGNLNGALYFNTNNTSLGVRTGVDTTVNVGLAGIIIPGKAPEVAELNGLYHYNQRLGIYTPEGREFVDETVCVECGNEMQVGDTIALKANAIMEKPGHNSDVHAIFQHLHLEQDPEYRKLQEEVQELRERLSRLEKAPELLAAAD